MLYPAGSGTRAMPSEPAPVLNHPPRLSSLRIVRSARFARRRERRVPVGLGLGYFGLRAGCMLGGEELCYTLLLLLLACRETVKRLKP